MLFNVGRTPRLIGTAPGRKGPRTTISAVRHAQRFTGSCAQVEPCLLLLLFAPSPSREAAHRQNPIWSDLLSGESDDMASHLQPNVRHVCSKPATVGWGQASNVSDRLPRRAPNGNMTVRVSDEIRARDRRDTTPRMGAGRGIGPCRLFPVPIERVWHALTDSRMIDRWLMRTDGFEAKVVHSPSCSPQKEAT